MKQRIPWTARAAVWAAVALALGGVFLAYLNPHRMLELSNLFWSCF